MLRTAPCTPGASGVKVRGRRLPWAPSTRAFGYRVNLLFLRLGLCPLSIRFDVTLQTERGSFAHRQLWMEGTDGKVGFQGWGDLAGALPILSLVTNPGGC